MTQLLRLQNFRVSIHGFGASEGQSLEKPGGSRGLDDYFTRDFPHNIGPEIVSRNKFAPQSGPWDSVERCCVSHQ